MDPIAFIDSKDIREHLYKIEYECGPVEASYFIWQSRKKTLEEKHTAWNWLIENTTDVPVPQRNWVKGWNSLHKMLKDYVSIENGLSDRLNEVSSDYVYQARSEKVFGKTGLARSFQACYEQSLKLIEDFKDMLSDKEFELERFFIDKIHITDSGTDPQPEVTAQFNLQGKLMEIDGRIDKADNTLHKKPDNIDTEVWDLSFDGMWFDIPTPFKKGDIVQDLITGTIFVLEGLVPWFYKERGLDTYHNGDGSDMRAYGSCVECIFELIEGNYGSYDDANYLQIEYYRGKIEGKNELLAAYSAYLKKQINLQDFLMFSHWLLHRTKQEHMQETAAHIKRCLQPQLT